MEQHYYKVFGLIVNSEINLPELANVESQCPDVTIKMGDVPKQLTSVRKKGVLFESAPGNFLFRFENVCSYHVKDGNSIIIQPYNNTDHKHIRLFLLGTCMGALLIQRGIIPLHGNSIKIGNSAIMFIGKSTSGKSSLAAGFVKEGSKVISDDISAIDQTKENSFLIYPGIPHLKLWKDIIDHLEIDNNLDRIRPELEKYRLTNSFQYEQEPILLKAIIQLEIKNSPGFTAEKISGIEKFFTLRENTYRLKLIEGMGKTELHYKIISKLSQSVDMYRIERPKTPTQIYDLVNFIRQNILNRVDLS